MPERDDFLVPGGDGCYMQVRRIVASGSNRKIGRTLATLAKEKYGVRKLGTYKSAEFGRARMRHFKRNWPAMAQRMLGVADVFKDGLKGKPDKYDPSSLVYDMPPDAGFVPPSACSAVFLPPGCTQSRTPIVGRNFDAWRVPPSLVLPDLNLQEKVEDVQQQTQQQLIGLMAEAPRAAKAELDKTLVHSRQQLLQIVRQFGRAGKPVPKRQEKPFYSRSIVLELRPTRGRKMIALGGHDLLCPFQDVMNESGLYVTTLANDRRPLRTHMRMAGGQNTGISSRQLLLMLASKCDSVAEAKEEALAHLLKMDVGIHWLIADASGAATVLAVDDHGCPYFTDAKGSEPLFVTNHPLYEPDPEPVSEKPYNTFRRMKTLKGRAASKTGKYARQDAEELMDLVTCAFVNDKEAGVDPMRRTRTIWSLTADLRKKDFEIRFYLKDDTSSRKDNRYKVEWRKWRLGFGAAPVEIKEAAGP